MNHVIRDPKVMYEISPRNFEELIADLFANFGYEVELTKRTRDGGRDVIAIRQREVNTRYLIECKRWAQEHKVGVKPVRELLGVRADENASKAILATTAYFSADAKLLFERHPWELEGRDFDGLIDWLVLLKDGNRI
jgi:restriction system protein